MCFLDLNDYVRGSDGLYYKFHDKQVNWAPAKGKCESEGAHLAIIDSSTTFEYVQHTYNHYIHMQGMWLGARDVNSNNNWKWVNGMSVKNTYWESGEPNNYNGVQEDCMMTNYHRNPGRFHDAPCGWAGPKFLCQKGNEQIPFKYSIY